MSYLLTIQTLDENGINTIKNIVIEESPETWLGRQIVHSKNKTIVILNSIFIPEPNKYACKKINDQNKFIVQGK